MLVDVIVLTVDNSLYESIRSSLGERNPVWRARNAEEAVDMLLLGRCSRLVLDSWTRPKYFALTNKKVKDETIVRRFRRYGDHAGLAHWLFLTSDLAGGTSA